jgi:hypothetical protein
MYEYSISFAVWLILYTVFRLTLHHTMYFILAVRTVHMKLLHMFTMNSQKYFKIHVVFTQVLYNK